jgi:quinolinate synthase
METDLHLVDKIQRLKKERDAIILAHNYQIPSVQDMADFSGDSLELSRIAAGLESSVIVFCGVHFMAETAALLAPEKTVLLPSLEAGCPMADMIDADSVIKLRHDNPDSVIVCYVNSSAAVKAECDTCCTSANAIEITNRIPKKHPVIFVPDQYLAGHAQRLTNREIIKWPGYCNVHARILPKHVEQAKAAHPGAPVIIHPEARGEVCLMADEVLSTGGMCRFAKETSARVVLVGTETGLLHRLKKENPDKEFFPILKSAICPNMKETTLENVVDALENMRHRVVVDSKIAERARLAVQAMLGDGPIVPR